MINAKSVADPFDHVMTPGAIALGVLKYSDWRLNTTPVVGPPATVLFPRPGATQQSGMRESLDAVPLPQNLAPLAVRLCEVVPMAHQFFQDQGYPIEASFIVTCEDTEAALPVRYLRFRVQNLGINRYAMRLLATEAKTLNDPSAPMASAAVELLSSPEWTKQGGLVLIVGSNGTGKTTTACSTVRYHLETFGGYAMLVEDPVESPSNLNHWVGKGFCDPIDATVCGYAHAIQWGLRACPVTERSILMIGEIRTPEAAVEVIRAAVDGRKVLTTVHGKSDFAGLARLVSLATAGGESHALASEMLADGLFGMIHQRATPPGVSFQATRILPAHRANLRDGIIRNIVGQGGQGRAFSGTAAAGGIR